MDKEYKIRKGWRAITESDRLRPSEFIGFEEGYIETLTQVKCGIGPRYVTGPTLVYMRHKVRISEEVTSVDIISHYLAYFPRKKRPVLLAQLGYGGIIETPLRDGPNITFYGYASGPEKETYRFFRNYPFSLVNIALNIEDFLEFFQEVPTKSKYLSTELETLRKICDFKENILDFVKENVNLDEMSSWLGVLKDED